MFFLEILFDVCITADAIQYANQFKVETQLILIELCLHFKTNNSQSLQYQAILSITYSHKRTKTDRKMSIRVGLINLFLRKPKIRLPFIEFFVEFAFLLLINISYVQLIVIP